MTSSIVPLGLEREVKQTHRAIIMLSAVPGSLGRQLEEREGGAAKVGLSLSHGRQEISLKGDGRALVGNKTALLLLMEKDLGRRVVVSVLWLRKEFPTGWTNHHTCLYLQESPACRRASSGGHVSSDHGHPQSGQARKFL